MQRFLLLLFVLISAFCSEALLESAEDSSLPDDAAQGLQRRSTVACPESGNVLMQRRKESSKRSSERALIMEMLRKKGKQGKFANLLASEMEDLVASKGKTGISPEEALHIHSIKDLILETIVPAIAEGVEDSQAELDELHGAVMSCVDHVQDASRRTSTLESSVKHERQLHKECRKLEDSLLKEKTSACSSLDKAIMGVHPPAMDFKIDIEVSNRQMHKYLTAMNEHYCGRWEDFEEKVSKCDTLSSNLTTTHAKCKGLQQGFEESFCTWKIELEQSCHSYNHCWTEAVQRFNVRKEAIAELQEGRLKEYSAAVKVNCLWDAWEWDRQPCTVDEEKVRECKKQHAPDAANVTLVVPELPPPPPCDVDSVAVHPCSTEFVADEYVSVGAAQDVLDDMKETCSKCAIVNVAPSTTTPHPALLGFDLTNIMSASHDMYVKTGGQDGHCDASVVSKEATAAAVSVHVMQTSSRVEIELTNGAGASYSMTMESGVASANGKSTMYQTVDTLSISITNGIVSFNKGTHQLSTIDGAKFETGYAKVRLCTAGASVKIHVQ